MPRNPRCVLPGEAYHVTQRGTDRQDVFRTKADREVYLDLIRDNKKDAGVRILSYALMTNHIHFVARPDHGDGLAVLFRRANGRYAQYFNARCGRTGHLWQARFHSCILSPRHLEVALRYVEFNPVRAGIALKPQDYPWSSAARHLSAVPEDDPLLDSELWRDWGGAAGWSELLDRSEPPLLTHLLRRCTHAGRPFGDSSFLAAMEERFARQWKRWPFEKELTDAEMQLSLDALRPAAAAV